ncbi:peptidoglycan DD-metalloendopeptidase family protein [Streptomyces sp. KCTC 0041BP]|uniref:peptidoglycan DD-metalloendopeptidase family protein n=1 Tax=Streptomyces sp. KCTC 0041BP TaxID=201500 RepID=UPI001AE937CA|nr:peptidoglycan DD-metalloendopeptidase family protein [Streptomyces sp. KCTC 0041BP]MBP0935855.1 peptidoglycan DD-metalloendopeptidase family protein [Streptomyces sp. KCTC 0041BP]
MNDRPSSGQYPDLGYDGLSTTTFAGDTGYVSYETQGQGYNYAYNSYETGAYDTTAWTTQDSYPQQDAYLSTIPSQGVTADGTGLGVPPGGGWETDTSAWTVANEANAQYPSAGFGYDTSGEQTGHWAMPGYGTTAAETGAYDATTWNTVVQEEAPQQPQPQPEAAAYSYGEYQEYQQAPYEYAAPEAEFVPEPEFVPERETEIEAETGLKHEFEPEPEFDFDTDFEFDPAAVHDLPTQAMPVTTGPAPAPSTESRAARRAGAAKGANSRRRTPAKRSALLTVAVPSVCVMGVAGVAAASVGGLTDTGGKTGEEVTTLAAPDPASVKPVAANSKLDTQLAALSADAGDFADRASRTQERIDLHQRQEDEKKRKAEEAAAKEAARPKFAIPVAQHGLSATFGQAGGMWMSVHTGIDFPVGYGTPVMAATDGTVRTQWNSAYGNMAIVTSPDGTETWYCHLSSTKIRSGKVKAGDVIAYSGNSGNSTGPHLHFEVRPGGGAAIDPLPWLRSHDLDPN